MKRSYLACIPFLLINIMNVVSKSPSKISLKTHVATFAGGCFWCMEHAFEEPHRTGIIDVISGYANGDGTKPTYKTYAKKGYIEAVQITFDPERISYDQLLDIFWRNVDPTDPDGQFVDRGKHYRSAIFYHNRQQIQAARKSRQKLAGSGHFAQPIVTEIVELKNFYPAEKQHQNYHKKHAWRYRWYRSRSGRDTYLRKIWK